MNLLSRRNNKFEIIMFYFVLIDTLFLPYFKYFVMPISLPFLSIWFVTNLKFIKNDFEFKIFVIICFFILISTISSYLYIPKEINGYNIWSDNFKRCFQLLSTFIYYFYIKSYRYKNERNIVKIFILFLFAVDILAILSIVDIGAYFQIKNFLGVRDPFMDPFYITTTEHYFRYSYLWIDPNNCAYIVATVGAYLIINHKLTFIENVFVAISVGLILLVSMSTGALVSVIIVIIAFLLTTKYKIVVNKRYKLKNICIFIASLIFLIILAIFILPEIGEVGVFDHGINRMINNEGESRLEVYFRILREKSILTHLLIGEGYTVVINNIIRRPHSDHLRIIFGYGGIVYICLIIFLFRIRKSISLKKHIFIIPAFICFSINTLLDEQKIIIIFLTLIALMKCNQKEVSKNEI